MNSTAQAIPDDVQQLQLNVQSMEANANDQIARYKKAIARIEQQLEGADLDRLAEVAQSAIDLHHVHTLLFGKLGAGTAGKEPADGAQRPEDDPAVATDLATMMRVAQQMVDDAEMLLSEVESRLDATGDGQS